MVLNERADSVGTAMPRIADCICKIEKIFLDFDSFPFCHKLKSYFNTHQPIMLNRVHELLREKDTYFCVGEAPQIQEIPLDNSGKLLITT